MCGICGYSHAMQDDFIIRMTDALKHRGPDSSGYYTDNYISLGHARLSIIDLVTGNQPLFNEDKSIVCIINGEIYNYKELYSNLQKQGHVFATKSDSETVVHLYEEYGEEFPKHLDGMFACAVYNKREQRLFLVRDRMGKKPIYYTVQNQIFVFASELKAIIAYPNITKGLAYYSFYKYLVFEYVPSPNSILKDIYKLPAGYYLNLHLPSLTYSIHKYWDIVYNYNEDILLSKYAEEYICKGIYRYLKEAVSKRLMSDVPLGVFLSGGIDSSSIVAILSELVDPSTIKTFSIGFREKSFDESNYARRVAQYFKTDHHEEILSPYSMIEILPEVIKIIDEPFADISIIPTYLLSKFAKRYITVALGGDGGDELFAGYDPFKAHKIGMLYNRFMPIFLHNYLTKLANKLPASTSYISLDFKIKQFLKGVKYPDALRHQIWLGVFTIEEINRLINKDIALSYPLSYEIIFSELYSYFNGIKSKFDLDYILYLYTKLYLQDDILVKVDRASMANALEVRSPLLDKQLVEFVSTIPPYYKLKGLSTKYIFHRALKDILPPFVLTRHKKGFGVPSTAWFRHELRELLIDTFSEERIKSEGFFNYAYIKELINAHILGKQDNRKQIWALYVFEMWFRTYGTTE